MDSWNTFHRWCNRYRSYEVTSGRWPTLRVVCAQVVPSAIDRITPASLQATQNIRGCRTLRFPEGCVFAGWLVRRSGAHTKVHRRDPLRRVPHCGSVDVEATVRTLKLSSAARRSTRPGDTLLPGTLWVTALASARTRIRRRARGGLRADSFGATLPTRSRSLATRSLCPGRLRGTSGAARAITRHTCRVNFALTHSKQTIGALTKCHTFRDLCVPVVSAGRGSAGARLEAKN